MAILKRRQPVELSLIDTLIATIGERPMRLPAIARSIAKQGHSKATIREVRLGLEELERRRVVTEIDLGFVSVTTRRIA